MTRTLPAVPALAPLYARAAAGAARKRPDSTELATPALAVRGVTVDAARDAEFRRLAGAPDSAEAFFGHVHALIMPIQMELMAADDFPLPMMGLVHLENTYRRLGAVALGARVDVEVRVAGFRGHRAGTEVLLDATVTAAGGGETLVEERSVYLAKGRRLPGVAAPAAGDAPRGRFRVPVPTACWRLPAGTGRAWAKVSGDWNPIHVTGLTAKALGMPGVIAHGMYTASRALAEAGVPDAAPFEFAISFGAPVTLPAKVLLAITPAEGSGRRGDMDIVAWHGRRKRPHFTGSTRML